MADDEPRAVTANTSLYEYRARRQRIIGEVYAERGRQDGLWGEQNHPNGTGARSGGSNWSATGWDEKADRAKEVVRQHAQAGTLTWLDIMREEMYEAFAESDPTRLRTELVQIMAVGMCWIEKLDRDESNRYGDAISEWLNGAGHD